MLWGLHHTVNVPPVRAVVSTILVGLRETLANAGVEYMVSAGSNPVSPDMGENLDLSLTLSPLKPGGEC